MDDDILKQILEELKKQTDFSTLSAKRVEEMHEKTEKNIGEQKVYQEKLKKSAMMTRNMSFLFVLLVFGYLVYTKIESRSTSERLMEKVASKTSEADSIYNEYKYQLGYIETQLQSGSYKGIIDNKDEYISRYTYNPDIYYYVGVALFNTGRIADSKQYFVTSDSLLSDPRNQKYLNAINKRR